MIVGYTLPSIIFLVFNIDVNIWNMSGPNELIEGFLENGWRITSIAPQNNWRLQWKRMYMVRLRKGRYQDTTLLYVTGRPDRFLAPGKDTFISMTA